MVSVSFGYYDQPRVWKSTDGGVTFDNITEEVQDASNLPGPFIQFFYGGVSVAPDDEDYVVIAGGIYHPDDMMGFSRWTGTPAVVASNDGGDNFSYAGDTIDSSNGTRVLRIYDVDVAAETDDVHNIALAGMAIDTSLSGPHFGSVFRLEAGTWLTGGWEDLSSLNGWDEFLADNCGATEMTEAVIACALSGNYPDDFSLVALGVDSCRVPYLQQAVLDRAVVVTGVTRPASPTPLKSPWTVSSC
jgi:hypothetical protein